MRKSFKIYGKNIYADTSKSYEESLVEIDTLLENNDKYRMEIDANFTKGWKFIFIIDNEDNSIIEELTFSKDGKFISAHVIAKDTQYKLDNKDISIEGYSKLKNTYYEKFEMFKDGRCRKVDTISKPKAVYDTRDKVINSLSNEIYRINHDIYDSELNIKFSVYGEFTKHIEVMTA